jgi:hypothetical protein
MCRFRLCQQRFCEKAACFFVVVSEWRMPEAFSIGLMIKALSSFEVFILCLYYPHLNWRQKYEKACGETKKMCKNFFIREYFTNFAIKKIINSKEYYGNRR